MAKNKYPIAEENVFKTYCRNRNIKETTIESYKRALQLYSNFTNKTLQELLDEAVNEEEKGIRKPLRKIKEYLICFNNFLETEKKGKTDEDKWSEKSITKIMVVVRSFYGEYDIELPKIKRKQRKDKKLETFNDLPTIEDIQKFLEYAKNPLRPIVILGMSSGMGKAEICTLTFEDLYKSINLKYYPEKLSDIILILEENKNSVPYWEVRRVKNGSHFFTFSTPESLDYIRKYLENLIYNHPEYMPENDDELFRNVNSNDPITANGLSSLYDRCSIRAGLKKTNGKTIVGLIHYVNFLLQL